jgi:hypothetical protein
LYFDHARLANLGRILDELLEALHVSSLEGQFDVICH